MKILRPAIKRNSFPICFLLKRSKFVVVVFFRFFYTATFKVDEHYTQVRQKLLRKMVFFNSLNNKPVYERIIIFFVA